MASKKDKYPWKIGEPPPPLNEHSTVKHDITAEYIRRYIHTLLSGYTWEKLKLTIVDGFSGGGKYTNELNGNIVSGSPFLILDTVNEAQAILNTKFDKPKVVEAEYHFVELEKDYFEYLSHELNSSKYKDLIGCNLFLHHSEFDKAAPSIIKRILERNKAQRSLFILDQFSYKDVPFQIVNQIMRKINKSEIILTFGFESLQSFLSDNETSKKAMKNIGLYEYIDWDRLDELKRNGLWQHAVQEQLSSAIKAASGANHMTLFFFEPKKGWAYWLVHLSKEYKARSVMMDIHWDSANTSNPFSHVLGDGIFALGYKANQIPKQAAFDFTDIMQFDEEGKIRCVNALTEDLPRFIYNNSPLTFESLLNKMGDLTAATEDSIKEALQPALELKEISIINSETQKPRRASKNLKKTDIIQARQHLLFPLLELTNS